VPLAVATATDFPGPFTILAIVTVAAFKSLAPTVAPTVFFDDFGVIDGDPVTTALAGRCGLFDLVTATLTLGAVAATVRAKGECLVVLASAKKACLDAGSGNVTVTAAAWEIPLFGRPLFGLPVRWTFEPYFKRLSLDVLILDWLFVVAIGTFGETTENNVTAAYEAVDKVVVTLDCMPDPGA